MSAAKPKEYKQEVRGQYEDFPYPFRDPLDEGKLFHGCDPHSLQALSHAGWGGKRDLRHGARILIAGCGTGDSAVMFAEEIRGGSSEIVAIDLSSKSIEIAQARIRKRGLGNITFKHMSILDLPNAGLGQFDIVESGGVLHHLPDPDAGLAALASMLKPDGLMAVMVYAQYGRMAVYLVQELMRQLMTEATPRAEKIAIAREYLSNVPIGHWLTFNSQSMREDFLWPDGSGIYDLLLHSTDRAYTVPQLYDWVEGRGLKLLSLYDAANDGSLYEPRQYTASPVLHAIFDSKTVPQQQAIAELMKGTIIKHYFHAGHEVKTPAALADDMVIDYGTTQQLCMDFLPTLLQAFGEVELGRRIELPVMPMAGLPPLIVTKTTHAAALMRLIDGVRSVGDMLVAVMGDSGAPELQVRQDLAQLYTELRRRQMVFLRHHTIPRYLTGVEISARMRSFL